MPSETFFRLPEHKQERLMEAIREEVARVPYEDFSIGNVVEACTISRGSFYKYFRSKEDIYLYLMAGYQNQVMACMLETLQKNGGRLFDMMEVAFRYAVRMMCYKGSRSFRHNLFCNMGLYEKIWQREAYARESRENMRLLRERIDRSCLKIADEEELTALLDILMIGALKDAAGIFTLDTDEGRVVERFLVKLNLLRRAYELP